MSENPLEFHEHREHAMHAAEANDPLITRVSITIAILAVVTAIIGSIESVETAGAVLESNKATLQQALASDQWAYYQAKGIKKRLDEMAAASGGPNGAKAAEKAKEEGEEQKEISNKAKEMEAERDAARKLSEIERLTAFAAKHGLARLSVEGPGGVETVAEAHAPVLRFGGVPVVMMSPGMRVKNCER